MFQVILGSEVGVESKISIHAFKQRRHSYMNVVDSFPTLGEIYCLYMMKGV